MAFKISTNKYMTNGTIIYGGGWPSPNCQVHISNYAENEEHRIYALIVEPNHRRKGLASALMDSVCRLFGHHTLSLGAQPDDPNGIPLDALLRFYERYGFRYERPRPNRWVRMERRPHPRHLFVSFPLAIGEQEVIREA